MTADVPPAGRPQAVRESGAGRDGSAASSWQDVVSQLRRILAEVTGNPSLLDAAPDTALLGTGAGLDSLTGTLLLRRVQQRFGIDVAAEDLNLDCLATLGTLAEFIAEHSPSPGRSGFVN